MAKLRTRVGGGVDSKITRAVLDLLDVGKKMDPPSPRPPRPTTPPAHGPRPNPKDPHPTHPDRNADGTYRGGGAPNGGKAAESAKLDELETVLGPIERQQVKAQVPGADNGRFYDGLVRTGTDPATGLPTYSGIEIKSGDAALTPQQRGFDSLVSPTNPGRATLNGQPILITNVMPVVRA